MVVLYACGSSIVPNLDFRNYVSMLKTYRLDSRGKFAPGEQR